MTLEELIAQSFELEKMSSRIQKGKRVGMRASEIDKLVREYMQWFGDCLAVLPPHMHDRFREQYEAAWWQMPKIKDFLVEPTSRNILWSQDAPEYISYWQHPFDSTFRKHLLAQRQILIVASKTQGKLSVVPEVEQRRPSVFLVHGHDERYLQECARFLEIIGLEVIVLRERPDRGRTIIEKFEEECSTVKCAVVLLTGDDRGGTHNQPYRSQFLRARQNVIWELGFFSGRLGRGNVLALYQEGVELPSDYHGILYTKLDEHGAWRGKLANELRAAGLPVDLNKAS